MAAKLRVVGVQVRDVLGVREFEVEPGTVTVLTGKNASGKSSVLQAVQTALGGGNLARLARIADGEDVEPEVVLCLEGEGSESYRVERKGDKLRVRERVGDSQAFRDVARPQAWLSSLFDPRGSNPVAYLTASDKDLALLILEALPLEMDTDEMLATIGVERRELGPIPDGRHPLETLSLVREAIFGIRTGVNRDQKSAEAAVDKLLRSLPAELPDGHGAEIDELARQVDEEARRIARDEAADLGRLDVAEQSVRGEHTEFVRAQRAAYEKTAAAERAALERRLSDLKASVEDGVATKRGESEAALAKIEDERVAVHVEARRADGELATSRTRLSMLRQQAEEATRARALREQADEFEAQACEHEERSRRLSASIEALDRYRRGLADNLPVPGLSVSGQEVSVDGVPFRQLNTARRVEIAVQIATLRAKDCRLPLVFVDGAEALDSTNFDLLVDALKTSGVDSFLARVSDVDELTVAKVAR